MLEVRFYPESDKPAYVEAARDYQEIWDRDGARITEALELHSNTKFDEKLINALVYEGITNAYPMRMRASIDYETKRGSVVHELCHRLLDRPLEQFGQERGGRGAGPLDPQKIQAQNVATHKRMNPLLYKAWVDLWGKEWADAAVEREKTLTPAYQQAWEEALAEMASEK